MKKHFAQLFILIPLIFIAGATFATYSYIGNVVTAPNGNTDGPLDGSATDQIKYGGLAVNAFQSRTGSAFAQSVSFTGLVNGGIPSAVSTNSTLAVGVSGTPVSINEVGNATIVGNYQSDSLRTGGGLKPICADQNGLFYICGAAPVVPPPGAPVYLHPTYYSNNNGYYSGGSQVYATASLSEPIISTLIATINIEVMGPDNFVCPFRSGIISQLGTVAIPAYSINSVNSIFIPPGCSSFQLTISNYTPTSTNGRPITVVNDASGYY